MGTRRKTGVVYLKGTPGGGSDFVSDCAFFDKYLESLGEIAEAYFSTIEKKEEEADPYEEILEAVKRFEDDGQEEESLDELPF